MWQSETANALYEEFKRTFTKTEHASISFLEDMLKMGANKAYLTRQEIDYLSTYTSYFTTNYDRISSNEPNGWYKTLEIWLDENGP